MQLKKLAGFQAWKDLALDIAWRGGAGRAEAPNPDWALSRHELQDVRLRWPAEYEWPNAKLWVDPLLTGLRKLVPVEIVDLPQPYQGIVLFQIVNGGRTHDVTIDYFDLPVINDEALEHSAAYFKMQFANEGYGSARIVPAGYVPDSRKLYLYLPSLRRTRDRSDFDYQVYGRFSLDYAKDRRRQAIEILRSQTSFAFEGGLTKVGYVEFLKQIARSKVCIDLPGNGDLCHRLINYFAVGACVIGPRHRNRLHVPLEDRKQIVFAKDDLSDLVELCAWYLEHDEEREAMVKESRRYFDRYLHRDNLAAYYLRNIIDQLVPVTA